jgi:hypothetical protein
MLVILSRVNPCVYSVMQVKRTHVYMSTNYFLYQQHHPVLFLNMVPTSEKTVKHQPELRTIWAAAGQLVDGRTFLLRHPRCCPPTYTWHPGGRWFSKLCLPFTRTYPSDHAWWPAHSSSPALILCPTATGEKRCDIPVL